MGNYKDEGSGKASGGLDEDSCSDKAYVAYRGISN